MPELPEVETIRRGLEKHVVGLTLTNITIRLPKIFQGEVEKCIGSEIQSVRRFGKGLVIDLSNNYSLAIHVKMTGQLIFQDAQVQSFKVLEKKENVYPPVNIHIKDDKTASLPNKYTHVIFEFKRQNANDKSEQGVSYLYFNDIRQFGWIRVVASDLLQETSFFNRLGKEPLRDLTLSDFKELLHKSKAPIKQLIMDQQKIAGVGNIYANDALWDAQIHPLRSATTLSESEAEALFYSLEKVLSLGIEVGGASERDYVNVLGEKGGYQHHFLVYKRTGKPCKRCDTPIERIVVGGRGTFICPTCQVR